MTTTRTKSARKSDIIAASMSSLSGYLSRATVAPGLPKSVDVKTKGSKGHKQAKTQAKTMGVTSVETQARPMPTVDVTTLGRPMTTMPAPLSVSPTVITFAKRDGGTYPYSTTKANRIISDALAQAALDGVGLDTLIGLVVKAFPSQYAAKPKAAAQKVTDHIKWLDKETGAPCLDNARGVYVCPDAPAVQVRHYTK
jgi:hypothetical protein